MSTQIGSDRATVRNNRLVLRRELRVRGKSLEAIVGKYRARKIKLPELLEHIDALAEWAQSI